MWESCRFILFEMIVDLACTLVNEMLADSLAIAKQALMQA